MDFELTGGRRISGNNKLSRRPWGAESVEIISFLDDRWRPLASIASQADWQEKGMLDSLVFKGSV